MKAILQFALKGVSKIVADNILILFCFVCVLFFRVIRLGISCASSARQTIYIKMSSLIFSEKKKKKKIKVLSALVIIITLRVSSTL